MTAATPAEAQRLFIDASTLQDLDVLTTARRDGTTLWSLVDRTRTRIGRQLLRDRLVGPPRLAEAILSLQQAHRLLADDERAFRAMLDGSDADRVEAYLGSTWQLPADMPAMSRLRAWHRQYLKDVGQGQTSMARCLVAAAALRQRLADPGNALLAGIAGELAALLDSPEIRRLQPLTQQRSGRLQQFDQLARGDARPRIAGLLECVGQIDALSSMGIATREHGWSYPRPSSRLRVTRLVHPLLGANAVANDLQLDDRVRVCFVTGPNMAGKSTFLKAVALSTILAHAGCGVPADAFEFPAVGTVFSSIDISDNLAAGESFYLAEVRRIAALARSLSDHGSAVAVIDEPFRGTNAHDAAEGTLAVITRLASHPGALVFVASHLAELATPLGDDTRVALLHFAAEVRDDQLSFDYRLRAGVSSQRLGMTLLQQERVLDLLDQSARRGCHVTSDPLAGDMDA